MSELPSFQPSTRTIHSNGFFSAMLKFFGQAFFTISGWRLINQPPAIAKYIVIAAPHTSNWDFLIFMASAGYLRTNISFLAKHSLFEGYFGRLFYWLGGIPVKRESVAASAVVDQVVKVFSEREHLILGIAPEGTRSRVAKWKTGFYRIAMTAGVPIVPGYVDSATKTIGFGETFTPSGDIEADLVLLQDFYKGKTGVNPQNH